VHSPFGGQGLNLGLGDAMNLGWKLAAVCRGDAGPELLDTYTAERHPIGRWVLDWTRAQISMMRPDPHARAMRAVVKELLATQDATTYMATRLSGVWQRYDLGADLHPLVGASCPELAFADGTGIAEHLHGGKAVLVDTGKQFADAVAGYEDRLTVVNAPYAEPAYPRGTAAADTDTDTDDPMAPAALLIRPDGYVAWACDAAHDLAQALRTWLGAPKPSR
jgi:hypothetical protein